MYAFTSIHIYIYIYMYTIAHIYIYKYIYVGKFLITYEDNGDRVRDIVDQIKDLNPDVVLWCDWSSCALPEDKKVFFF
jgi:hypothetical protein